VIFSFIEQHKEVWPVSVMCETFGVSPPKSFYAWRQRPTSARQQRRDALLVHIRAARAEAKQRYGSPRVAKNCKPTASTAVSTPSPS
jgi:putative transposase